MQLYLLVVTNYLCHTDHFFLDEVPSHPIHGYQREDPAFGGVFSLGHNVDIMTEKPLLVAAVSGGVDSMVMLDQLVRQGDYRLLVAHVNHGIRPDSDQDEALVRNVAGRHGLDFMSIQLNLGPVASEDKARQARWQFLNQVKKDSGATAVATAHHLDDVVETVILNFRRGTGWRGLASLRQTAEIKRPLLDMRKSQVIAYAIDRHLDWREDSTNYELKYSRNWVRSFIMPRLQPDQFDGLVELWRRQCQLRPVIDQMATTLVADQFDRSWLDQEDSLAIELLRAWLGRNYQTATFGRLLTFGREALPGKKFNLPANEMILASRDKLVDIRRRKLVK